MMHADVVKRDTDEDDHHRALALPTRLVTGSLGVRREAARMDYKAVS
jgi:hypothetical protein